MTNDEKVPIYRHGEPSKPIEMASYECKYLEDIEKHIEAHIGAQEDVLHEIISPTVHIDIHIIRPTKNVPYLTIVTSGMSDLDMTVPQKVDDPQEHRLAEIIAFLPPDWRLPKFGPDAGSGESEENSWYPFRWMKHYARMPHEHQTFLTWFHTTANGEPAQPIHKGVGMTGFLFAPPLHLQRKGLFVPTHDGRKIRLLSLVPIWPDEVVYAINWGGEALCDKLDRAENIVFDPARQSCVKRTKLFGLF